MYDPSRAVAFVNEVVNITKVSSVVARQYLHVMVSSVVARQHRHVMVSSVVARQYLHVMDSICFQGSESEMLDAVAFMNPISVAFQVTNDFMSYESGVYSKYVAKYCYAAMPEMTSCFLHFQPQVR